MDAFLGGCGNLSPKAAPAISRLMVSHAAPHIQGWSLFSFWAASWEGQLPWGRGHLGRGCGDELGTWPTRTEALDIGPRRTVPASAPLFSLSCRACDWRNHLRRSSFSRHPIEQRQAKPTFLSELQSSGARARLWVQARIAVTQQSITETG